jgi:xanthine/CO dehydrogenase XdhC/CoxF family maturation factor
MVIQQNAPPIGIVSGGCLESDLAEHAGEVQRSHCPKVVTYDTRADDDAAWGLGLGCNGLIDVLLEPLVPDEARKVGELILRGLDASEPAVLATVVESEGDPSIGAHALIQGGETYTIGWTESPLLESVRGDSAEAFAVARHGLLRQYGPVTVAFEIILPSVELLICGSGPDVVPLVSLAAQLDWNLTVVDHRPTSDAHTIRFPGARIVECQHPLELTTATDISRFTAAVVMSHNYVRDLDYVRALLASDAAYIGVLGPRSRTERILADMTSAGEAIVRGERIYSPVGLDLGGDGPERIALSIIAEVAALVSHRSAGHLRDSRMPLHPAPAKEVAEKA